MISSIARLRLSAIAAFPPAPNWGPKGWGVDHPDSGAAERFRRFPHDLSRSFATALLQHDAWYAGRRLTPS